IHLERWLRPPCAGDLGLHLVDATGQRTIDLDDWIIRHDRDGTLLVGKKAKKRLISKVKIPIFAALKSGTPASQVQDAPRKSRYPNHTLQHYQQYLLGWDKISDGNFWQLLCAHR